MKAIVRNVLLACLISTFAFFGVLGKKQVKVLTSTHSIVAQPFVTAIEKENLSCLGVALLTWVLCIWRCFVINRRLSVERKYKQRFNDYMRESAFNRHRY
jgi:type III secretory pathway component EscU